MPHLLIRPQKRGYALSGGGFIPPDKCLFETYLALNLGKQTMQLAQSLLGNLQGLAELVGLGHVRR